MASPNGIPGGLTGPPIMGAAGIMPGPPIMGPMGIIPGIRGPAEEKGESGTATEEKSITESMTGAV